MPQAAPDPRHDWCHAYVKAWAELSAGLYDSHAAWDDAGDAFDADHARNPALVAAEHWARVAR